MRSKKNSQDAESNFHSVLIIRPGQLHLQIGQSGFTYIKRLHIIFGTLRFLIVNQYLIKITKVIHKHYTSFKYTRYQVEILKQIQNFVNLVYL